MELLKRSEQKLEDTWNLELIYKNLEEYYKDEIKVKEYIEDIKKYQNHILDSSDNLLNTLELDTKMSLTIEKLHNYSQRKYDEDLSNPIYQELKGKFDNLYNEYLNATSFITPELLKSEYDKIEAFINKKEELKKYELILKRTFRYKEHTLSENEEKILSELSQVLDVSEKISGIITDSEMIFGNIKDENGNDVKLTNENYSVFIRSNDKRVRHDAFMEMYNTYSKYKNTLAACIEGNVASISKINKIRGYKNSRYASLYKNRVNEEIYDNLVNTVNNRLDVLYKYFDLKKNTLGLSELNLYDTYLNISNAPKKKYSFNEAKDIVLDVVKVLGNDYVGKMKELFDKRYIDIYPNESKRGGAYSSFGYETAPYILLNYQGDYNDVSTLIHEAGHSMHTTHSKENNDYLYYAYKIFVAEVASTVNETLFDYYMLEKAENSEEKKFIISEMMDSFKATLYRQTMFAEFEQLIYNAYENGTILTSEYLCNEYLNLNKKYFGNGVNVNEEIKYEWARIPHFYYNFYVYQYATGISAAYYIVNRIRNNEENAVSDYLKFLSAGDSVDPVDALKLAGVDMSNPDVVNSAIDMFDKLIDMFNELK